ncbi:ribonuclease H1-like isoform X2 [Xenia sp. Carnegie-2017]|uniref:ribonuclease H1-like isoform X2 n=1 Tax=Xenia sp. Carnegie-2017 TaxID=2897299 RepID=UPI001F0432E3|nr:ribonuclease H1-like isoform X2 [Xenia sp. Carnegie-2017]
MRRISPKRLLEALSKLHLSIMPFYAVRKGRKTGIYTSWQECKEQVDGVVSRFKKFPTFEAAQEFMNTVDPRDNHKRRKFHAKAPTPKKENHKQNLENVSLEVQPTDQGNTKGCKRKTNDGNDYETTTKRLKEVCDPGREVVYSDGCCFGNGRQTARAGIGVYWGENDHRNASERLQGKPETNQRAELNAAIKALETAVKHNIPKVEIRTDSKYTLNAVTKWMKGWKLNGFKTANGQDVKNKQDIVKLYNLCQIIDVKWTHVRGHVGVLGNEKADMLAKQGAQQQHGSLGTNLQQGTNERADSLAKQDSKQQYGSLGSNLPQRRNRRAHMPARKGAKQQYGSLDTNLQQHRNKRADMVAKPGAELQYRSLGSSLKQHRHDTIILD